MKFVELTSCMITNELGKPNQETWAKGHEIESRQRRQDRNYREGTDPEHVHNKVAALLDAKRTR